MTPSASASLVETSLALHGALAEPLAWLVVATFLAGAAADLRSRALGRTVTVGAWGLFAVFWFVQTPHFVFEQKSAIEGVGALVAVPVSAYVGYLLFRGRDSLLVLSRAIAAMGVVFMPFEMVAPLRRALVETVTVQTEFLMAQVGQEPAVISGQRVCREYATSGACLERYPDYHSTFLFETTNPYTGDPYTVTYTILIACTGIGSMAIFAGLVAAVKAPLRRKMRALAVSLPVIYVLNLGRNVFIGLSFGQLRAQVAPELIASTFGFSLTQDPALVSYYVADRILAQTGSVLALVAITYLVVRELPEVLEVVEDVLFVVTGSEWDLGAALDVRPVRADGEYAARED
jgi:archaeosortase A (PGF-CTERM-specific)